MQTIRLLTSHLPTPSLMIDSLLIRFWQCVRGPQLYQTYPILLEFPSGPSSKSSTHLYTKNTLETLGDHVLLVLKIFLGLFRITWPFILLYLYRKDSLTYETVVSTLWLVIWMTILLSYFVLLRGVGRFINTTYQTFIVEFLRTKNNSTTQARQKFLSKFDFALSHWKPDYTIESSVLRKLPIISPTNEKMTILDRILHYPFLFLGYICVNVFGRRLMFPGSLQILRQLMHRALLHGRTNLIVSHRAKRSILRTADGNHIDTIFVDRRPSHNGQMLIVTCEGNAGFYEVGCMMTPIDAGYSVLGWNRPGFGESSGYPGALSEINSIDAMMRYAIDELHFPVNHIVIFAWSIGGYSACWTAAHYQDIHGLVLDAIFDDVLPLAQRRMPAMTSKFVEKSIRYYLDLNNIQLLKLYNGPFYLIRRANDEIMNLRPGKIETNRANEIVFAVLPYRYPWIYRNEQVLILLREFVCSNSSQRKLLLEKYCANHDDLQEQTTRYRQENPTVSYPCRFGENFSLDEQRCFAVYLIDQYLVNFNSQHCTPLPERYFFIPCRSI